MANRYLFLLIFGGIGAALTLVAVFLWSGTRRFVSESLRAQGTVIRLAESRDSDGTTYSPVVRFAARGGGEFEFTDPVSSRPAGYRVGQQVEVLYHWQDHNRARLASPFRLYFVPGLLGFLGLIFTSVGTILFFVLPASDR